jgi:hypothetical protein
MGRKKQLGKTRKQIETARQLSEIRAAREDGRADAAWVQCGLSSIDLLRFYEEDADPDIGERVVYLTSIIHRMDMLYNGTSATAALSELEESDLDFEIRKILNQPLPASVEVYNFEEHVNICWWKEDCPSGDPGAWEARLKHCACEDCRAYVRGEE